MVIIGAYNTLKVGERYVGITDHFLGRHPNQPYLVLREATYQEWCDSMAEITGKPAPALKGITPEEAKFYAVSVD